MYSELWCWAAADLFLCVPLPGRTDPIPIVVKYDVMGMGRMEMEVSSPHPCRASGEWVGKAFQVRVCASKAKNNLLLNQRSKKTLVCKMHPLFIPVSLGSVVWMLPKIPGL